MAFANREDEICFEADGELGDGPGAVSLESSGPGPSVYESAIGNLRGFEAPQQRVARLTAEVAELLNAAQGAEADGQDAGVDEALGGDPAAIAAELRVLEQRLGGLARDGAEAPGTNANAQGSMGNQAGSLAAQLERLATRGSSVLGGGGGAASVTYELNYAPSAAAVADSSKIAILESTVASIEKQLGVLDQTSPFADLQSAASLLHRRLAALDQPRMDAIRQGVQKTVAEVEAVLKKREELEGQGADENLDKKANELYEFCHRWSAVSPSLPTIISRLQSLQALHQDSASFTSRLVALEKQQEELTKLLESTSTAVNDLGKNLRDNMTLMGESMKGLEAKISQKVKA